MDSEDIARLVSKLNLMLEIEKDFYTLLTQLAKLGQSQLESDFVAKVVSARAINREAFRTQMPKILQASKHIEIEMVGDNIFLLDFNLQVDRKTSSLEGPWNFFKDLVIFKELSGLQKPFEIILISMWYGFNLRTFLWLLCILLSLET